MVCFWESGGGGGDGGGLNIYGLRFPGTFNKKLGNQGQGCFI